MKALSEEIRTQISNIDKETSEANATISNLNNEINTLKGKLRELANKRQHLQRLMEAGERAKEIQEAEKQLTELKRQANIERHKISDARRIVIEAAKNLEALDIKARSMNKKYPEAGFVHFDIPTDSIRRFSEAVPTSWAEL